MKKLIKNKVLIGAVVIVLMVAAISIMVLAGKNSSGFPMVNKSLSNQDSNNQEQPSQAVENQVNNSQKLPENLPPGISSNTLSPISGKSGSATYLVVSSDKNSSIALEAKLPQLPQSKFYAGWLTSSSAPNKFLLLGKLQNQNGVFRLSYIGSAENYSGFDKIIVTEEAKDDDTAEMAVLSGNFKN